jgi:hypothetical protein
MTPCCSRPVATSLLAVTLTTALLAGAAAAQSLPRPPASPPAPPAESSLSPGVWTRVEGYVESISPGGLVRLRTVGGTPAVIDVTTVAPDAARLLYVGRDVAVFGLVRPDGVLTARGITVDYNAAPSASPPSR